MPPAAIGQFLISEGIITEQQLTKALEEQQKSGKKLGEVMIGLGYISEEAFFHLLAMNNNMPYVDLTTEEPDPSALKVLTRDQVKKFQVLPYSIKDSTINVIIADPQDTNLIHLVDTIKHGSGLNTEYSMSTPQLIKEAMEKYYHVVQAVQAVDASALMAEQEKAGESEGEEPSLQETLEDMNVQSTDAIVGDMEVVEEKDEETEGEGAANDAPVIKLVNTLIHNAIAMKASDIHLEPYEKNFAVRYRLDGQLQEMKPLPTSLKRAVAARIKVMAKLDIVERRKPQDGKLRVSFGKRKIDLRVSTLPCIHGEKIVMRILDSSVTQFSLDTLGFEPDDQVKFEKAIRSPYGMVLVTGPTGSGKTRTLYTALNTVNTRNRNIMTAEDPVEFQIKGINQVNINPDVGLTFPAVLKAALRQDPNIILVGEIRDLETGSIAITAAMTGHLVLSTLHTNDAPSTVTRLVDMGVDNIQVGTSVVCVVAQRLLRLICNNCKEEEDPDLKKLEAAGIDSKEIEGIKFYHGKGCGSCGSRGYAGRNAIYEVMVMSEPVRDAIFKRKDVGEVRRIALSAGMRTLRDSAVIKLKKGLTTIDEVMRVSMAE